MNDAHARHNKGLRPLADFRADRRLLVLTGFALLIGAGGTAAAFVLIKLIALVTNLVWFGRIDSGGTSLAAVKPSLWVVAAPIIGGLVIGLMARFGSEKIRGHGIPEAIEAILIGGSRMSPKVAVLKPLSSAISIGTGGPFGAEGPIIMTGGAIGSLFAQFFHLTSAERKVLLVAGAVAGMTAIFGTPAAAVLLAVELLLFEWRPRSFVPVVAACLTAAVLRPVVFDAGPLFPFDYDPILPWWGLIACAGLGALTGLFSGLLTTLLYGLEDAFHRLPIHWMWWPAIGGIAVGLGGLVEPRALGVGYDVISDLLKSPLLPSAVLTILVVKSAIWLVALSSGTSGGVLAPLLILGGAMGWLMGLALPGVPGFWALLGMAAMLGGTMRAPLTGAIFAVELTGNLHGLTPLLAASATAYAVTVLLLKRSILTEKIARRGQHITREYSVDPYELMRVSDIMIREVDTIPADLSLAEATAMLATGRHRFYPALDTQGRPIGFVSRAEALDWLNESTEPVRKLADCIARQQAGSVHPDDVASYAKDLMLTIGKGRLAVTDPKTGALVGLVTRRDLLEVRAAVTRSEQDRQVYFGAGRRRTRLKASG